MSRFKGLNALRTEKPGPATNLLVGPIPIIYGSDGFVTFCTGCGERVSPGFLPRATLAAAVFDRIKHAPICKGVPA